MVRKRSGADLFGSSRGYVLAKSEVIEFLAQYFNLNDVRGKRVLDAGCRVGEFSEVMHEAGALVTGIDISESCISQARQAVPGVDLKLMDIRNLGELDQGSYDIVLCFGVMCYLKPSEWISTLRQLEAVCSENGKMLVLFQNDRSFIAKGLVAAINQIPESLYIRVVCPVAARILAPLSRWILGARVSVPNFQYRVLVSVRGIQFGFPEKLARFRVPLQTSNYASPATTAAFVLSPADLKLVFGDAAA